METEHITLTPLSFDRKHYSDDILKHLYHEILLPRMIEDKMLNLLRQNKISKWFSGIGQEAISVGLGCALRSDDYIMPLHRNLGVFTTRKMELEQLFCQWQGKKSGFTKGRDRSFHFGSVEHKVIGMISHLGSMLSVANGTSLASKLSDKGFISVAFSGDGGASEGEFHEAINTAAVWDLPVIFLVENNGYGLSTPSKDQFRCKQFIDKAIGYGIEGIQVDGNNILEVYDAVLKIAEKMRKDPKPVILECMTFRMRGHEEASGTKYVPHELMEAWATKDPVTNYEKYLVEIGVLTETEIQETRAAFKQKIQTAWDKTEQVPNIVADLQEEITDVYAPAHVVTETLPEDSGRDLRFIDALTEGLRQAMEKNDKLVLMGQDIADYGGVFKLTQGFMEQFGKDRVRNTPLCESAIIGAGLGLSLEGYRAMVEMQFADFVSCGFNQIVNNLAKTHYRWNHPVKVMVRMPTGAGTAAGPFHSQSNEAWFFHVPGLKIVYPATPYDAKGLLTAALREDNPVIFFEHKLLYRSLEGKVPVEYYEVPLGKARIAKSGNDASIITYGTGVHWALQAVAKSGADVEIIDLRTLLPWDKETVFESVKKTGKCLILHEDTLTGGIGAEIAACVTEELFRYLDAPVMRSASLDTPVPFNPALEKQFLGIEDFEHKLNELLEY